MMKLVLLALVCACAAPLSAAGGCPEDALRCAGGKVLSRDPNNHCEFPKCPEDEHNEKKQHQDDHLSKTFTFSNVHL